MQCKLGDAGIAGTGHAPAIPRSKRCLCTVEIDVIEYVDESSGYFGFVFRISHIFSSA